MYNKENKKILILLLIISIVYFISLYYIYNYPRYIDTFNNTLSPDMNNIVNTLSTHILSIKNLAHLSESIFKDNNLLLPLNIKMTNLTVKNNTILKKSLKMLNRNSSIINKLKLDELILWGRGNHRRFNNNYLYDLLNIQTGNISSSSNVGKQGNLYIIPFNNKFINKPHIILNTEPNNIDIDSLNKSIIYINNNEFSFRWDEDIIPLTSYINWIALPIEPVTIATSPMTTRPGTTPPTSPTPPMTTRPGTTPPPNTLSLLTQSDLNKLQINESYIIKIIGYDGQYWMLNKGINNELITFTPNVNNAANIKIEKAHNTFKLSFNNLELGNVNNHKLGIRNDSNNNFNNQYNINFIKPNESEAHIWSSSGNWYLKNMNTYLIFQHKDTFNDNASSPTLVFKLLSNKNIIPPPMTTRPGTTPPMTTRPGTTPPMTTRPGTTPPMTTRPGTIQPGTTPQGTTQQMTTRPGTTPPMTTRPGTTPPMTTRQ